MQTTCSASRTLNFVNGQHLRLNNVRNPSLKLHGCPWTRSGLLRASRAKQRIRSRSDIGWRPRPSHGQRLPHMTAIWLFVHVCFGATLRFSLFAVKRANGFQRKRQRKWISRRKRLSFRITPSRPRWLPQESGGFHRSQSTTPQITAYVWLPSQN